MFRRHLNKFIFFILLFCTPVWAASPRSWHKSGTASTTSAAFTVGSAALAFGPATVCIRNNDATNTIFVAFNQVAVATDDSEGIILTPASPEKCITFSSQNVLNTMTINLVSSAATPAFIISAVGSR